ncbi:MAG: futalosine hydrolase [Flavobacteriales bacterium]|nr:futalosine hydrolase [Flavobacteriales bacterium]
MPKKILLVAATHAEIVSVDSGQVDSLIAGIGMVATSCFLTRKLMESQYDLVINIGIAGSFNPKLAIGTVVQVVSDRIAELGVEDKGIFIPANELNLVATSELKFDTSLRVDFLQAANGVTVNRVHGSVDSIVKMIDQFNPDVESMEGAAVAYVCEQFGVPWVQIRAISNKVEPRNRDAWNIPLAIKNLHLEVEKYICKQTDEA